LVLLRAAKVDTMNAVLWTTGRLLAVGFALLIPLAASASPVTAPVPTPGFPTPTVRGLTGTGMAAPGVPFVVGSIDTNWTFGQRATLGPTPSNLSGAMSVVANPTTNGWVGNTGRSQWIQPHGVNPTSGYFYYQASFDLTGQDLSSFELSFRMTADDAIEQVLLNDWVTPFSDEGGPGDPLHGRWSDQIVIGADDGPGHASPFRDGMNTLTFVVRNDDSDSTGLQVQFAPLRGGPNAVPNPEPMTLALFGALSLAGVVGARRMRKA
jgi:hypothetical protein